MALSGAAPSTGLADRWVVKLEFVGGRARPAGQSPAETVVSYFQGPRVRWQIGLPTYTGLVYPDLWPGIDLAYTLSNVRLKYQFTVQPGTDPAHIRLAYRGATAVRLTAGGRLQVSTPVAGFKDEAPHAYQIIAGECVPVEVAYQLVPLAIDGIYEYGFQLGAYD